MESSSATDAGLRRQTRHHRVVADLSQRALETNDLDRLFHDASAAIADTLETEYSAVFENASDGAESILRRGAGWSESAGGDETIPTGPESPIARPVTTGESVVIEDVATDDRFAVPDVLERHDVVSGASVAIRPSDGAWGVLGTYTTHHREFVEDEVAFLQRVADVLASAIDAVADRHDSEERFRTMMEQSPFSIQIFDAEGETIAANPAWERLWDASRDELDDYNILEDPQLEDAGLMPAIRDAFAGEVVRLPVTHYDPAEIGKPGRPRWIEGYVYPLSRDGDGRFEVAIVHHDVTDRKEREEELRRVRERMEFALTATDAVVWDWNVDDDEASFYPSEQFLYGTTVEDWEDFIEIIHPEDRGRVERGIEEALETGEPKHEEIRIVRDEEVRWIEAPGQPVFDEDGPTRMIGVARDITERKTYERRLEESNERLEQFAHAASHDLQEPLRMVSSYLRLVEKRYADELDADGAEFIEFAVDGADRMRTMIDSLLAYSRIETRGKPFEPVDLDEVLETVLAGLAVRIEECRAEITAEDLPRVEGDADQLRQLFRNVLENALEYCGDAPPTIEVTVERDGDAWIVSVRDDGIGIDPSDHDAVFGVFQRLHSQDEHAGTGIGLALCERIVERHGGTMWVESALGDGATFSFSLPAEAGE